MVVELRSTKAGSGDRKRAPVSFQGHLAGQRLGHRRQSRPRLRDATAGNELGEQLGGTRVGGDDHPLAVGHDQRIAQALDRGLQALAFGLHRGQSLLEVGGHRVEGLAQHPQLLRSAHLYPYVELTGGQAARGDHEVLQRTANAPQQGSDQREHGQEREGGADHYGDEGAVRVAVDGSARLGTADDLACAQCCDLPPRLEHRARSRPPQAERRLGGHRASHQPRTCRVGARQAGGLRRGVVECVGRLPAQARPRPARTGPRRGFLDDRGGEQSARGRLERVGVGDPILVALSSGVELGQPDARQRGERERGSQQHQPDRAGDGQALDHGYRRGFLMAAAAETRLRRTCSSTAGWRCKSATGGICARAQVPRRSR